MRLIATTLLILLLLPAVSSAKEFRILKAISAPGKVPAGAETVQSIIPVDRQIIDKTVRAVVGSWNSSDLQKHLGDDFYDKERLGDNIQQFIPRDAKLSVLSIQGQQTLQQYEENGKRVSRVSVVVQTQVEFNDPQNGYQRFPGTTELVFKVKQRL